MSEHTVRVDTEQVIERNAAVTHAVDHDGVLWIHTDGWIQIGTIKAIDVGALFTDPDIPARSTDPETSKEAAWLNPGRRNTHRWKVCAVFFRAYPEPLTADEACGRTDINLKSTPWKRITELSDRGFLEDVGEGITSSNAQAVLHTMTPEGYAAFKELMYE